MEQNDTKIGKITSIMGVRLSVGVLTRGYEHGEGEYVENLCEIRDDRWAKNEVLKLYLGLGAKKAGRLPKKNQKFSRLPQEQLANILFTEEAGHRYGLSTSKSRPDSQSN